MEILRVRALRGHNVWSRSSALEARVALGEQADLSGDELFAFERRLRAWLPGWAPAPSVANPPTRLAAALRGVSLALAAEARGPGRRGFLGRYSPSGTLDIAIEYEEEALGRACLATAQRMCQAALRSENCDVPTEVSRLRALAEDVCLGTATGPLVAVARARDIPFRRLDEQDLVQLGHGARRRRIRTSVTERTGRLAEWLSLDKELCKRLCTEVGLPVPVGRRVEGAEEAWTVACALGLPVTVKPASAGGSHGVGPVVTTREQVLAAYAAARACCEQVLVERFVPGEPYRVTVVNGKVVAAARREPAGVVGPDVADVTDELHPAVAAQCVRAVRLLGLDVAGVDLVAQDLARPLGEQGGAILDVCAEPALALHLPPRGASHRPVCEAIIASLFPDGQNGRIPLALVSGCGDRAEIGRVLAGLLSGHGLPTARASAEGLFLGQELVKSGDHANVPGCLAALLVPEGEAAVLERNLASFREEGLGVDRVDVVVLTRLDDGNEPPVEGERAGVAGALLTAVAAHGAVVIPADDPVAVALVTSFQGRVMVFGGDGTSALRERPASVFLRGRDLVFHSRDGKERALPLGEGALVAAASRWLGAVAAAWAMDVPEETLRARLPSLLP